MGTPLLNTKLYVPSPRPNLVPRRNLIQRLDKGLRLGHQLSLISAPAGFGKTTLVTTWIQQLQPGISSAWLSLDEGDNEVSRFLNYLVAALQTVESSLGEAVDSLLRSPRLPPLDNLITLLINDLVRLSDRVVLILDDYHTIRNLEVHKALTFLLDNLPSQLHLVLVSREDPVLSLHRLRGQGQVTEIHARELRFSEDEAAHFLNQIMGLDLTPDNIAMLERRTEGWVTGLQLAAISMRGVADKQGFIEAFAGDDRYVADYLIAEVIDRQAPAIRQFLLTTSVLDRFTASLCDAVTGEQQGRDILSQLEQADLFIIPLDRKREWYRYHHLFGQLLHYRLREEVGAEGIQQLRRRAAAWCIQHDWIQEAIHHRLAAEDWSGAADLIESIGLRLVGQGRLARVLSWIEALPADVVLSRPLLCIQHAWVLNLTGQVDALEPRLQDAERALPTADPILAGEIRANVATMRAGLARKQHRTDEAIQLLRQALADFPADSLLVRSSTHFNLGSSYLDLGKVLPAERELQAARADGQASGNVYVVLAAMSYQADTYMLRGQLGRAAQLYEGAIAQGLAYNKGRPFPPTGYAYAGLGQVLYERNDLEAAERHLNQAIELGELLADQSILRRGLIALARLKHVQGEIEAAQALWQRALSLAQQQGDPVGEAYLAAYQARCWLEQAARSAAEPRLAAAIHWAETYQSGRPDADSYPETYAQLTLAWVEMAQGHPEQALARLEVLAERALADGRNDCLIKVYACQALARAALRDLGTACDLLERAFFLAEPEGYCRAFVDYGPAMQQLLQHAASRDLASSYLPKLLAAYSPGQQREKTLTDQEGVSVRQPVAEPLTDREMAVLRLIAAGLSNREIAEELYLSVNTIKWYTSRLYGKLGAGKRAEAVARAHELSIL